jgi:hypothetical protein
VLGEATSSDTFFFHDFADRHSQTIVTNCAALRYPRGGFLCLVIAEIVTLRYDGARSASGKSQKRTREEFTRNVWPGMLRLLSKMHVLDIGETPIRNVFLRLTHRGFTIATSLAIASPLRVPPIQTRIRRH